MAVPRILVVENEFFVALHISHVLERFGYEVQETVASGEQFLLAIEDLRPDLVLMDINIDGAIDGISAAACIPASSPVAIDST